MDIKWSAILVVFAIGCATKGSNKTKVEIPETPIIKLVNKDTSLCYNYVADIQAMQNVEIRARVQGYIEKILVDEGQAVKKGQLLFKLSDKEYLITLAKAQANLASAKSAVKIAEVELERIKTLVDKKVISKTETELGLARLNEAKARVAEAWAIIDDANHKLSYTSIRSPFDGMIDRIPLKTGSLVSDGALLTTISDNKEMYAYFDVSENEYLQYKNDAGKLAQNHTAALILSDGTIYPLAGRIETHETEFSDNTGSIAFRAKFPNKNNILKHGASGKVQLSSTLNSSLLVPQKSVFEIQDKNYVFVLDKNNTVKMKSFVPKLRISSYYVVASGLNAGDEIVYEGVQDMKDGAQIKPVYKNLDSLIAAK